MDSPLIIPLAGFAVVVVIVAITHLAKIRDMEMEAHQRLRIEFVGTGEGTRSCRFRAESV